MTPGQIDLIQRSFEHVTRVKLEAGQLFYERLFFIAPELRPMFKSDIRAQASKLVDTLAYAVGQLPDGPNLTATLRKLGRKHLEFGVRPEHYETVGEALLWTLERLLAERWTPDLRDGWLSLYGTAATVMKNAGYSAEG